MDDILKNSKLINEIKDNQIRNEFINCFTKYSNFINCHMEMFNEYTDHSIKHIEFVIKTAEELIPINTFKLLNDKDLFVLLLSILYHDMGMHVSIEAVKTMIRQETIKQSKFNFKEDSLKLRWQGYYSKIKKYDEDQISELFEKKIDKSILDNEEKCLNNVDILREFVRTNHHVIAHDIALNGFSLLDETKNYSDTYFNFYHDLAGFVARSHGMDIRDTYQFLKEIFHDDWKTPHGIHVIYHMIVLRIADFVHITSDRVNPYKLRMFHFSSERSKLETEKHLCTYESHRLYDSPRTLFFSSEPLRSKVFFEMDTLISQIQFELDTSWGILGEVYGHTNLELTLRRIDSNIKYQDWLKRQRYVTEKIDFQMDHRLVSLLVKPLYGNNPSYGVRELIQNSTDACRILVDKLGTEYKAEIKIEFYNKDEVYYLSIEDNGSGMDLDIIKNYFLKIGVSFKKSDHWKDNANKSTIRNGRFGIGVLASFLLGDEIEVITKRHTKLRDKRKDEGVQAYSFKTKIYSKCIDIIKEDNLKKDSGTKITIKLSEQAIEALKKDMIITYKWYINNDVEIKYYNRVSKEKEQSEELSESNKINLCEKQEWNRIENGGESGISNFTEVWWSNAFKIENFKWYFSFEQKSSDDVKILSPNLVCNGIVIPEKYDSALSDSIIKEWPTLYIKDINDELDFDLSRYKLNSTLPFMDSLRKEIYGYFIYLLLNVEFEDYAKNISFFNPGGIYKHQSLIFYKDGFSLCHPYFLNKLNKKITRVYTHSKINIKEIVDSFEFDRGYVFISTSQYSDHFKSEIINKDYYEELYLGSTNSIIVKERIYNKHMDENAANSVKFNQGIRATFKSRNPQTIKDMTLIDFNYQKSDKEEYVNKIIGSTGIAAETIKLIIENSTRYSQSGTQSLFDDYFKNNCLIPYDMEERKEKFKNVFNFIENKITQAALEEVASTK